MRHGRDILDLWWLGEPGSTGESKSRVSGRVWGRGHREERPDDLVAQHQQDGDGAQGLGWGVVAP